MDILQYIPIGRKNAISRYVIADRAGICERKVRGMIREVNNTGRSLIIADTSAGGYFVPDLSEEADRACYNAYLRQERHRANEIYYKIRKMEKADNYEYYGGIG